MNAYPPPHAAGGAARPGRCPGPLPHGLSAATRRLGGRRGHGGRTEGGGASLLGDRPSVLPGAHDGTARRIVRPQDPPQQAACESGKTKDHTVKNVLLVKALLTILLLSDTCGGRVHKKRIADATPSPLPAAGWCRIWASWRARCPREKSSCRPRHHA